MLRTEHLSAVNVINTPTTLDSQGKGMPGSNSQGVDSLQQLKVNIYFQSRVKFFESQRSLVDRSFLLQSQLAEERIRSEALSAEVLKLSAELMRALQSYNKLTWL